MDHGVDVALVYRHHCSTGRKRSGLATHINQDKEQFIVSVRVHDEMLDTDTILIRRLDGTFI